MYMRGSDLKTKCSTTHRHPDRQTSRHQSAVKLKYSLKGATGGVFLASKCIKTIFRRGSAPDPTPGAYDARVSPAQVFPSPCIRLAASRMHGEGNTSFLFATPSFAPFKLFSEHLLQSQTFTVAAR